MIEEVEELKVKIQEAMFEEGMKPDDVRQWNYKIEDRMSMFEDLRTKLDKMVKDRKQREIAKAKQSEQTGTTRALILIFFFGNSHFWRPD